MSNSWPLVPTHDGSWINRMIQYMLTPRRRRRVLFALWLVLIFCVLAGSLDPHVRMPGFYESDKFIHASAYFALAMLPSIFFKEGRSRLLAMLAMITLGGGIEIAQRFVPGRDASLLDFAANCLGVAAGLSAGLVLAHLLTRFDRGQAAQRSSIASHR